MDRALPSKTEEPRGVGDREVETFVVALLPEFRQARVEDTSGFQYAITRKTKGIDIGALSVGQQVVCVVTGSPSRVVEARPVSG